MLKQSFKIDLHFDPNSIPSYCTSNREVSIIVALIHPRLDAHLPFPSNISTSQVRHEQCITLSKVHRIHSLRDQVDDGLVRRQGACRALRKTQSPLDNDFAIQLDSLSQLTALHLPSPMRTRKPMDHLITNEEAELLLKLELWFGEAPSNSHNRTAVDAFCGEGSHECLQVRRETEWHGLGVVEDGFACRHTSHEL